MERCIYALPKVNEAQTRSTLTEEEQNKLATNVFTELEEMRKKRFTGITRWKCKPVTRKYCFEMPIPHGDHKLLKIKYDSTMP